MEKSGKTLQAEAGQLLFTEGDDSVAMYFLFNGQMNIKGKAEILLPSLRMNSLEKWGWLLNHLAAPR
jgi:hypothetical protein